MKTNMYFLSYLAQFFVDCEIFHQHFRIKQGTHFVFSNFIRKSFGFWDSVEKYCRAGQTTDDNVVQVLHVRYLSLEKHSQSRNTDYFPLQKWL